MKRVLLRILCCPYCKNELDLRETRVSTEVGGLGKDNTSEEILEGILRCRDCNKEYPVINGIPRLCKSLWDSENKALEQFKAVSCVVSESREKKSSESDVYDEIEKLVRKRIAISPGATEYVIQRKEHDILFRIRECEKQTKYVYTLNKYFNKKVNMILDVGGGQGGLIKCFNDFFKPTLSVLLDYDITWVDVAKLRNPSSEIVRGDATCLPFKQESIDLVLTQSMLEHVKEYDQALSELCRVTREACFIAWGPNKYALYDIGHVDAPVTIFPKNVAIHIAYLWHALRRTKKTKSMLAKTLDETFYISTTHVKRALEGKGCVYNVFPEFMLHSIKSDYSYNMRGIKKYLRKHNLAAKMLFGLLSWLRVEPQSYYILIKNPKAPESEDV